MKQQKTHILSAVLLALTVTITGNAWAQEYSDSVLLGGYAEKNPVLTLSVAREAFAHGAHLCRSILAAEGMDMRSGSSFSFVCDNWDYQYIVFSEPSAGSPHGYRWTVTDKVLLHPACGPDLRPSVPCKAE